MAFLEVSPSPIDCKRMGLYETVTVTSTDNKYYENVYPPGSYNKEKVLKNYNSTMNQLLINVHSLCHSGAVVKHT